uniref:Uncharacterized protein n=1 Tax=Arundo donax TaxID=35708 RepID=A0A0A9BBK8_ARUDO
MCDNYEYDPPQGLFSINKPRLPLPLCEFIEYVGQEQSPDDIAEVERLAAEGRARWRAAEVVDSIVKRSNRARLEEAERSRKYEAELKQCEEETRRHAKEL